MLCVPGANTVRGYSFFGDSFVYILFDDKTDPYWARSRVVEYLNQVQSRLPPGAAPRSVRMQRVSAGSTSTRSSTAAAATTSVSCGRSRLVSKFELKTVADVAEVASIGGMVRQYQVVLDPDRMRAFG